MDKRQITALRKQEEVHTAYHEAGHVLSRFSCGWPFRYVTIRARGGCFGRVALWREKPTYQLLAVAVIAAAGNMAEAYAVWKYEADDDVGVIECFTATLSNGTAADD